jgi:putative DNA primase/helicase
MQRVAKVLEGIASEVRWFTWEDAPGKGTDAADHPDLDGLEDELYTSPLYSPDVSDVFSDENEKTEIPPFPVDALPGPAATHTREAAKALGCPPETVGIPTLAALSGAMGRGFEVRIKRKWHVSAGIYAGVVADAGEMKSPAQAVAIAPLVAHQAYLREEYAEDMQSYNRAMREHTVKKKLAAKDDKPEPDPPEHPILKRCLVDDHTIEALAARLEQNPRGFLCAQDELTGFLRGMDQYKSGGKGNARQQYLKIWSNGAIFVDRKQSDEPVVVPKPYLTIQGGIQPSVLHEISDRRDDGFLDRFLFAYPERTFGGYTDEEVSEETEEAYERLIDAIFQLSSQTEDEDGKVRPKVLTLDEDARELFKEAKNELAEEKWSPGFPANRRGPWSKMDTQLAKLALIIAVGRGAEAEEVPETITGDDMRDALRLLAYFKGTTRKVYGQLFEVNPDDKLARALSTFLTSSPNMAYRGTISILHGELKKLTSACPRDVRGLGRALRRICERTPALSLEIPPRGDEREIILTLRKNVGNDGNVGNDAPDPEDPTEWVDLDSEEDE